jgi:hypothetical protein
MGVLKTLVDGVWTKVGCGGTGPGRLRVWTGSGWVREACDDDTGTTFTDDFSGTLAAWDNNSQYSLSSGGVYWSGSTAYFGGTGLPLMRNAGNGGSVEFDVTWPSAGFPTAIMWLALNEAAGEGYYVRLNASGFGIERADSFTDVPLVSHSMSINHDTTYRLHLDYDAAGLLTATIDGTNTISVTDTTYLGNPANVDAGIASNNPMLFDNAQVTSPIERHPLKIEDPDNPGTWITVARMVPV